MFENDALQSVSESEITVILDCLKPLFPLSIHVYYFIDSIVKWKKKVPDADIGILTPTGGHKSGAVFLYVIGFNHFIWTSFAWTKEGEKVLQNALLVTKRFQWKDHRYVSLNCVTNEMWAVIEPILPKLLKDRPPARVTLYQVYWLPADEAAKFDIKVPEGMKLGELKKEHAKLINSVWPHRTEGTEELIETMMWVNFGRGLFKADGQLVAWAFYWYFGALGVVQTAESERRRGYGKVVVQAVSKEMGSLGLDVHLNIFEENTVSEAFFKSLGFKHAFSGVWAVSSKD